MAIRAVPDYLSEKNDVALRAAPPGHKFGMYLDLWGKDDRGEINWTKKDMHWVPDKQRGGEKQQAADTVLPALKEVIQLPKHSQDLIAALRARQAHGANRLPSSIALRRFDGMAEAPFITGLGNEHPLENGFAFLNPYGLPYLAGSGVKGTLRRAAEELVDAQFPNAQQTWRQADVWALFGFDNEAGTTSDARISKDDVAAYLQPFRRDEDTGPLIEKILGDDDPVAALLHNGKQIHYRGALAFWDVIPEFKLMAIEVMTPHQSHYYQKGESPHESGMPVPIRYLAVPAGAKFAFHSQCDLARIRLWPNLGPRWEALLREAFDHAFSWIGFGAKTAVGYGAMLRDDEARAQWEALIKDGQEEERKAKLSPEERALTDFQQRFEDARKHEWNPGGEFHQKRQEFIGKCLEWPDPALRERAHSALMDSATNSWGLPKKTERKQALLASIAKLLAPHGG